MSDGYRRRLEEIRTAEARAELQGYYNDARILRDAFGALVKDEVRS